MNSRELTLQLQMGWRHGRRGISDLNGDQTIAKYELIYDVIDLIL